MNRPLLLCLLVALVLRLSFVLLVFPVLQNRWQLRDDGDGYRPIAQTIRDHQYNDVTRGPVYPSLVAACPGITLKILQALLDTAVVALLFWLAGRQLSAAWLWALYPFAIWRVAFVNKETVLTFYLVIYLCLQLRAWRSGHWRDWMAAGLACGLVNLCKPMFLLWPILLLAVVPHRAWILIAAMLVLIVPWTYRNWRVTGGEFLPVATERGGVTTFIGNFQPTAGNWEGPGKPLWQAAVAEIIAKNAGASVVQLDRVFYRAAWQQFADHPIQALGLALRKCGRFWFFSAKHRELLLAGLIQGGYLALLGIGLWRIRPWNREIGLLLAMLGYVMVVHALSYADLRFSLPVIPCVCVLASRTFAPVAKTSLTGPCQQA